MADVIELTFLGTGASVPSAKRGLPALVVSREGEAVLLDCGEATQFRISQADLHPSRNRTILISHLHGDHFFGLPGFLSSQQMADRQSPLMLAGPPGLKDFFSCLKNVSHFNVHFPLDIIELDGNEHEPLHSSGFKITARPLEHRVPCLGYRLEESPKPGVFDADKAEALGLPHGPIRGRLQKGKAVEWRGRTISPEELIGPERPGRVIAYCTDTRPCDNAVKLAEHADVLIHDSTFNDAFAERARHTFHSTAREAAKVAQNAGARQLVLWHISTRLLYHDKELLDQARDVFLNSVLSQDLQTLSIERSNR